MSHRRQVSERTRAVEIAMQGMTTRRIGTLKREGKVFCVGKLLTFTNGEYAQLQAFRSLVQGYVSLSAPPRPLCLAVFGPPGSGKSYTVRAICEDLEEDSNARLPMTEVNLTELASTADLIRVIRRVRLGSDGNSAPVIFFDEFDAPLAGVPLGWLSRFLAPMQDGTLFDAGEKFELKRAVYIFAGGTAARMADFGESVGARFREAKGPDFVSRLRGFIDVKGPNDQAGTLLRRAVLVRSALEKVGKARAGTKASTPRAISRDLLDAMLDVGRYRHGSRSIDAIIEMAAAASLPPAELRLQDLPPDHVLGVHRDLGQLDPLSIGGLIGLSAGAQKASAKKYKKAPLAGWTAAAVALARELWKIGAVVGYGGKWEDTHLTKELLGQLTSQAKFLVKGTARLTQTPVPRAETRVEVFARDKPADDLSTDSGMLAVPVPAYWDSQSDDLNLRNAVTAFRMRWMMSCRCVARVLIAGKISGYSGRMPGILEETMLALSLGQPLYVVGGYGGGAQVVGELLGLAAHWPTTSRKIGCFAATARQLADMDRAITTAPSLFRPAGSSALPLTYAEAMAFVTGYSIGGPGWPSNGLTLDENRELFVTRQQAKVVELVLLGLTRRFPG